MKYKAYLSTFWNDLMKGRPYQGCLLIWSIRRDIFKRTRPLHIKGFITAACRPTTPKKKNSWSMDLLIKITHSLRKCKDSWTSHKTNSINPSTAAISKLIPLDRGNIFYRHHNYPHLSTDTTSLNILQPKKILPPMELHMKKASSMTTSVQNSISWEAQVSKV